MILLFLIVIVVIVITIVTLDTVTCTSTSFCEVPFSTAALKQTPNATTVRIAIRGNKTIKPNALSKLLRAFVRAPIESKRLLLRTRTRFSRAFRSEYRFDVPTVQSSSRARDMRRRKPQQHVSLPPMFASSSSF